MKIAKRTLIEAIIGIWILAAVVILAGVFFVHNPLAYVLGEIVGSGTASLLMIHMYRSIDIELDLPEKKSVNHSRIMIMIRSLIELGVLFGSFYIAKWVLPYTVLAGLFGRKFAPMLVPVMEKFLKKGE
ncbi:MAG: hypothetical protein J5988_09420 [Eubacterium sp.]|nr:hypothetical protein [Eubacterium sp.]